MAIADVGAGAQLGLKQLLMQRLQAKQYADQMKQQEFENQRQLAGDARANRQLDETSALRKATEAAAAQQKTYGEANTLADQIPGDTFLGEHDPAVATMQQGGRGSLLTQTPEVKPMGEDFQGPMQGGVTPEQAQVGRAGGFLKTRSAKQIDTEADNVRQQSQVSEQHARDAEIARHNRADENKPASGGSFQLVPEVDPKSGQQTGRFLSFNTKTNSWSPVQGEGPQGTKAGPGAAQNAQHEQAKHEALGSLDQLDQAIEAAKELVGPGAGRVSSIQQMIGSTDPKISVLGTKMLLAKMQVDHAASGTVRAGASPQILSRWDNILGNNQTPEGLKASVQAMREILGGQPVSVPTSGGTVAMVAPDGRALNVPAEKVAELEAKGAKRR